ncbi:MAG: hypothetical protein EOQ42_28330 [Mesorhizobium sp.]|uniref:hypothetical protein n=1 Tax=Mesorhizobium sp. TaxID=1871066 RepID=UPI000FE82773|nr:hypothetical protein [Mesorhizobium sp.]RWB26895.1 MAG: hypothetical protein EOQ43_29050 [Mesorhizobium sp.]RWB50187.1 MAG: hypothetical protein EOQ42_28330 [Mesorhizobium sp.]
MLGHAPKDVWDYTPRSIHGFLGFARRRQRHEAASRLAHATAAARGDPKDVRQLVRELQKD